MFPGPALCLITMPRLSPQKADISNAQRRNVAQEGAGKVVRCPHILCTTSSTGEPWSAHGPYQPQSIRCHVSPHLCLQPPYHCHYCSGQPHNRKLTIGTDTCTTTTFTDIISCCRSKTSGTGTYTFIRVRFWRLWSPSPRHCCLPLIFFFF